MVKFGIALDADEFEAHRMIDEAIENSSNLFVAMESIAAMYGIPSSNVLVNDDLRSVNVVGDNIICPSTMSAKNNVNTIVRSISTVLDNISNRIDSKINDIQTQNVQTGKDTDDVISRSDPAKGKVIGTYKDDDGGMVIAYDSGIIDAPNTPAGMMKAKELRSSGTLPTLDAYAKKTPSYFNDEDDLMKGVNTCSCEFDTEFSYANTICESSYFIDAMAKLDDTPTLGYTLFTTQGYDCVKPTMDLVQEAATGKAKSLTAGDIKYMKFDNSEIYKAIACLNKARKNQEFVKYVENTDVEAMVRDPNFQEAIDHLEKQFNCRITIKWIHADRVDSSVFTTIFPTEYRTKLTMSKSKGFQLGGAPINIIIVEDGITELISNKPELFGQCFVSVMLHEIFHNIAGIMRYENAQFITSMTVAMEEACAAKDAKTKRIILEKYVDALNEQMNGKLSKGAKKLMVKRLLAFSTTKNEISRAVKYDTAINSDTEKNPDSEKINKTATKIIKHYKNIIKDIEKPVKQTKGIGITEIVVGGIATVIGALGMIICSASPMGIAFLLSGMLIGGAGITFGSVNLSDVRKFKKLADKYNSTTDMEEYYCDLMSGMYQLPQRFFIGTPVGLSVKRYSANDFKQEDLDEIARLEKLVYQSLGSEYPTSTERTWAGVTMAKKILECKNLDKSIEDYLKWVVQNNDNILKTGIKEDYLSHSFDPAEAEDLDQHVQSMLTNNKVTITEAAMAKLADSSDFSEWLANGQLYTESEIAYQEECDLMKKCEYLIQESTHQTSRKVFGSKDEKVWKRILLFIPRLITNCLEVIFRILKGVGQSTIDLLFKMITPNKMYKIPINLTAMRGDTTALEQLTYRLYEYFDGTENLPDYLNRINKLSFDSGMLKKFGKLSSPIEDFSRFDSYPGEPKNPKKDEGDYWEITGKAMCDCIVDIHKTGDRITPKLRRLLAMHKRLVPKEGDDITVSPEQMTKLNKILIVYQEIYLRYNTYGRFISEFKRKMIKDRDLRARKVGGESEEES